MSKFSYPSSAVNDTPSRGWYDPPAESPESEAHARHCEAVDHDATQFFGWFNAAYCRATGETYDPVGDWSSPDPDDGDRAHFVFHCSIGMAVGVDFDPRDLAAKFRQLADALDNPSTLKVSTVDGAQAAQKVNGSKGGAK